MKRGLAVTVALAMVTATIAVLTRPLVQSLLADVVAVDLGLHPERSTRARIVDEHVLDSIKSQAFNHRELRLRLDHPSRRVNLEPFLIDRCEVRQIDFERFAKWYKNNSQALRAENDSASPDVCSVTPVSTSAGHPIAGLLHSPATGVDFYAASCYCAEVGGRLPWAEELEAVASGREGRLYAWGDTFDPDAWPYLDAWRNAARRCGSHPLSDSPQKVHDLNGNAMEWSAGSIANSFHTPSAAVHGAPAVRSRGLRALYALNAAWLPKDPLTRSHDLGFRCVYDDDQPPNEFPWGDPAGRPVRIEGGEYPMGLPSDVQIARLAVVLSNAQLRRARDQLESCEHEVCRIEVGRCEVRRAEYRVFLNDPLVRWGLFANEDEPEHEDYIPTDWERQLEAPNLPVSGVSWWAADAYARWAGGRLPRVEEWQILAGDLAVNPYPWGSRYDPNAAVTGDLREAGPRLCPAAGFMDQSVDGVHHLRGNVSEWTKSIEVGHGTYAMWVQGGNWLLPGLETTLSDFGRPIPLNHRSPDIGFRIVYD